MARKSGLGKGLDALIPRGESILPPSSVAQIPVDSISPNPRQPRGRFDEGELEELTISIREHGIIQPLIVTRDKKNPTQYFLVAGERRLLAARKAGLRAVPAIVRETSEQQQLELALIENLQRTDLSPLEAAEAYRQLADDFNLSHSEIAERVGKSRVSITNKLRLLKLPLVVQQSLNKGQISEGHARALLALPTTQAQTAALQTILTKNLSVRQTEELTRKLTGEKPAPKPKPSPPPELVSLEARLREDLGTKVRLQHGQKGGKLVIHYYSDEELDRLVHRLIGDEAG
jgi:ParB family chromosome partitioning protein